MEEYINALFFYSRKHFRKLVKIIRYMLIERNVFYPCCNEFDNIFLYNFDSLVTVAYFTCYNDKGVFKNADEKLKDSQVNQNNKNPLTSDSVHQFHQIFHIWLSFYNHRKQLMSTNKLMLCLIISLEKIKKPLLYGNNVLVVKLIYYSHDQ